MNPSLLAVKILLLVFSKSIAFLDQNNRKMLAEEHKNEAPAPAPAPANFDGCLDVANTCHDHHNLTSCIKFYPSTTSSNEAFLLLKNGGESPLKVNVTIASVKKAFTDVKIPGHQTKKINISVEGSPSTVVLNAGNGECLIFTGSRGGNFYDQINSYARNLNPIHGAYLLILTAVLVGGTCACIRFGKRGLQQVDGIQYQELEMGQPNSPAADIVETAESWDQGWGDDWEETNKEKNHQMDIKSEINV